MKTFFGSIRQKGGNSDNLTPIQFKRAYRKLFHNNLLQVASGNFEDDKDQLLTKLSNLEDIDPVPTSSGKIYKLFPKVKQKTLIGGQLNKILAEEVLNQPCEKFDKRFLLMLFFKVEDILLSQIC